jgi:hypothetical protein
MSLKYFNMSKQEFLSASIKANMFSSSSKIYPSVICEIDEDIMSSLMLKSKSISTVFFRFIENILGSPENFEESLLSELKYKINKISEIYFDGLIEGQNNNFTSYEDVVFSYGSVSELGESICRKAIELERYNLTDLIYKKIRKTYSSHRCVSVKVLIESAGDKDVFQGSFSKIKELDYKERIMYYDGYISSGKLTIDNFERISKDISQKVTLAAVKSVFKNENSYKSSFNDILTLFCKINHSDALNYIANHAPIVVALGLMGNKKADKRILERRINLME